MFLCLAINLFWPMSLEVDLWCVSLQKARLAWNEYRFLVSTNIMFRSLTCTERVSSPGQHEYHVSFFQEQLLSRTKIVPEFFVARVGFGVTAR